MANYFEVECPECGHDDVEKVYSHHNLAQCLTCGNVWEVTPTHSHGISEEAWEYADYCRDRR